MRGLVPIPDQVALERKRASVSGYGLLSFVTLLISILHEERRARRLEFDPEALQRIACDALGASECTAFEPLAEGMFLSARLFYTMFHLRKGSYNRTFRLSFDNGAQATAKFPFPLPGHTPLRTSSEVATLQFVQEATTIPIPVPKVLAWSAQKDATPVGSEFILLEYIPGVMLTHRWDEPDLDIGSVFWPLLLYEREFHEAHFASIGSLYFKEDVSFNLQQRPLFANDVPPSYEAAKDKYRVGPLADRQHWRGSRSDEMYDHGPWPDMLSYFRAVANNQILFLKHHAEDEAPFRRPPFHPRDVHISILETFLEAIPLVLPPPGHQIPLLWHPDLSAQNIIVDAEGRRSSCCLLIDWQDTTVSPFFMQGTPPPLIIVDDDEFGFKPKDGVRDPDPFPDDLEAAGISATDEDRARLMYERVCRMMWYMGKLLNQEHRAPVLVYPHTDTLGMLPHYITRSWEDGIIPLRKALYKIDELWDYLAEPGTPRPAALVKMCHNRAADEAEHAMWDQWMEATATALDWIACRDDGLLSENETVAQVTRDVIPQLKQQWATDDNFPEPYPFADGQYSFFLT
ncbi:hypothetical protein HGRIS_014889 [Hohenbuehelia grisea]|uniref:Altered inheritance of mitochondria protein 9, mitochondrial n=1 Tax=Hohenbuehelia grisea TaxID=104357 RepID=A0ABR3IR11_9AGAR